MSDSRTKSSAANRCQDLERQCLILLTEQVERTLQKHIIISSYTSLPPTISMFANFKLAKFASCNFSFLRAKGKGVKVLSGMQDATRVITRHASSDSFILGDLTAVAGKNIKPPHGLSSNLPCSPDLRNFAVFQKTRKEAGQTHRMGLPIRTSQIGRGEGQLQKGRQKDLAR